MEASDGVRQPLQTQGDAWQRKSPVLRVRGRTDGSNERLLPIIRARERTAPGLCPLACASGRSGRFQRAPAAPPRHTTAGAAAPAPAPSSPASTRPDARAAGGGGAAAAAVLIPGILSHGDPYCYSVDLYHWSTMYRVLLVDLVVLGIRICGPCY